MPVLLFRLNGVPDDEADEVRELLSEHHIRYYETHAGRWGISLAAIWLKDDHQLADARHLIDAYQVERAARARSEFERQRQKDEHDTLFRRLVRHPLRVLLYLLAILAILYLSAIPFLGWR